MKTTTNVSTETMILPLMPDRLINFKTDPLWQRLDAFSLDDADASFPFSAKLARENNWDAAFAQAAILEYKRFVYLCCTLPQGASPSPIVDEVWHLHLCYTVNYWEVFCETILQRKLHHHPNKGGPAENKRHHNWLDDTLANYRSIFGIAPPVNIWNISVTSASASLKKYHSKKWFMLMLAAAGSFIISGCSDSEFGTGIGFITLATVFTVSAASQSKHTTSANKKGDGSTSGCGGTSGCSGGDGGGCGGGCGGCGGGCGS